LGGKTKVTLALIESAYDPQLIVKNIKISHVGWCTGLIKTENEFQLREEVIFGGDFLNNNNSLLSMERVYNKWDKQLEYKYILVDENQVHHLIVINCFLLKYQRYEAFMVVNGVQTEIDLPEVGFDNLPYRIHRNY